MSVRRLFIFLLLLLLGIGFGGGVWWWRNQSAQKTTSIQIDNSLSGEQMETLAEQQLADEEKIPAVLKDSFLAVQPGMREVAVQKLQDPFLQSSCAIRNTNTCLVNIFANQESGNYVVRQGNIAVNVLLDQEDYHFAMGRILGQPDNVRAFFTQKYGSIDAYFVFVKHLTQISQSYRLNPAFVYSLYDYYLQTTAKSSMEVKGIPTPYLLVDRLDYSLQQINNDEAFPKTDAVSPQFMTTNWTTEGKALAMSLAWTMADKDLYTSLFSQSGGVDLFYTDRIQSDWDNKPFTVINEEKEVTQQDYEGNQAVDRGLAICRAKKARLCSLVTSSTESLWQLRCSPASFLDQFCDGTLPNLGL